MSSSSDPLAAALADLDALESAGLAALPQAAAPAAVEAVRIEFLGLKQGRVKAAQERLKTLEPAAQARLRPAVQRGQAGARGGARRGPGTGRTARRRRSPAGST